MTQSEASLPIADKLSAATVPIAETASPAVESSDGSAASWPATMASLGRKATLGWDAARLMTEASASIASCLGFERFFFAMAAESGALTMRLGSLADPEPRRLVEHFLAADPHRSLAAFAIWQHETVVVGEMVRETRFQDTVLRRQGVGTAICLPLNSVDDAPGALGAFTTATKKISEEDRLLLETVGHLVGTSLACRGAQSLLAKRNQLNTALLDAAESLVLLVAHDGRILHANRACQTITGFAPAELKGRELWSTLLASEEVDLVRQLAEGAVAENPIRTESGILTKHGQRRQLQWLFATLDPQANEGAALIATAIDVTEKCQALEKLERTVAEASHTRRMLEDLRYRIERGEYSANPKQVQRREGTDSERRIVSRREFPYMQHIAPLVMGRMPPRNLFYAVQCRDISNRGFSFFTENLPDFTQIVVAFGVPPNLTHLTAEVRHVSPIDPVSNKGFVVGCQYTGRATYTNIA